MTRSVYLIVNPKAGRGRARKALPGVLAVLRGMDDIDLQVQQTSSTTDARARVNAASERLQAELDEANPPVLIVMGGDGMAHLGLNAAAGTDVRLGVIPVGTGNDFATCLGIPKSPTEAAEAIVTGTQRRIDLTSIEGRMLGGASQRWAGCVVSTGYDALVNRRTNRRRFNIGPPGYFFDALVELAKFKPLNYRLTVDGVRRDTLAMMVGVGNVSSFGGGMKICPDASPTDGLLDITIIHPVGRLGLLRLLPRLYDASFRTDPCVEMFRAREVIVDGDRLIGMADGEELGAVPLDCVSVSNALWVVGTTDSPAA